MNCLTRRRGFSLVEFLVVVGVVGILIALAVPVISRAFSRSHETVCLANLKGLGATMEAYLQAYNLRYPWTTPGSPLHTGPQGFISGWDWSQHSHLWPGLLCEKVASWQEDYPTWVCPTAPRREGEPWAPAEPFGDLYGPSYRYSNSFVADPRLWQPGGAADPSLLRAVGSAEVSRPALKVLMFDGEMAHLPVGSPEDAHDLRPMLFADGHAKVRRVSEATPGFVNPLTERSRRLHDTPSGVRGNDY